MSLGHGVNQGCSWLAASFVSLLVAAGLAGSTPLAASAASGRVAFTQLMDGSRGANLPGEGMSAGVRLVRTAGQAARVLRAWGLDTAATKSVDFTRQNVFVVLAEYQPTGGYRARVSNVVVSGREAMVTASVRYEGGELATQSIERPWVAIAVRKSAVAKVRDVRIRVR